MAGVLNAVDALAQALIDNGYLTARRSTQVTAAIAAARRAMPGLPALPELD